MVSRLTEQRREAIRSEIVSTAERIFLERGIRNTLLSDIAEEVGLGRAALYYYFPSKEHLITATIQTATRRFRLFEDVPEGSSVSAGFHILITELTDTVIRSRGDVRFLMSALLQQLDEPLEQQLMRVAIMEFQRGSAMLLRSGQDKGEVDPALDAEGEATRLLSELLGIELMILIDPEFDFVAAARRVEREFLSRIRTSGRRRSSP